MRKMRTALLSTAALAAGFMVQSAMAADMAVRAPIVAPVVSHWDGLYVSFSAGGTSTNAKSTEIDNGTDTLNATVNGAQVLAPVLPISIPFNYSDAMSGNEIGAVFTFTMGYNVVWGPWVAGIQSEVSYNKNQINLAGFGQSNASTVLNIPGAPVGINLNRTGDVFANLSNDWTVSEMARIGYLIAPDWQVYGLVGWSWGGFKYDGYSAGATGLQLLGLPPLIGGSFPPAGRNDATSLTLSGFTWGAGVEKDFGWLRAFIQYKGISYSNKTNALAGNAAGTTSVTIPGVGLIAVTDTVASAASRTFSADVSQVTAGVTIPLNWRP
ncbi:MAG: hypothetical protein U1E81_17535 [Xanthobacteraceae bacterium]